MRKEAKWTIRIYYEDTDMGGVVYHANYLKFAERARTEALRALGYSQSDLYEKEGIKFVVRTCELNCLAPAYLDDVLEIRTCFKKPGYTKLGISQALLRENQVIATVDLVLACVNVNGKPVKILSDLRHLLTDFGDYNNG